MKWIWACVLACVTFGTATLAQTTGSSTKSQPAVMGQDARFQRGAAFLTHLRQADPDYRLILMACLRERELNLLLSRFATPQDIPLLVKGLLIELSKELPGEDLKVIAFRPVVPLREAASARLNGRTGQISYLTDPTEPATQPY